MKEALDPIAVVYNTEMKEQKFYYELGLAIRSYRRSKEFSQDYMARKLNITQTAYSKIEAGKSGVSAYKLRHILNLLGIDPRIIVAPF